MFHCYFLEVSVMKNRRGIAVLTVVAAAMLVLSASAGAAGIPIVNAGFEDPVYTDGDWSYDVPPGWSGYNNSAGDGVGGWNPDNTGAIFYGYGGVAPEGQNVVWAGDGAGLAQVLNETLTANMTYTLSVEVGNSYYYDWAGYKIQLLAGGTLLAEDDSSVTIATDTFETSTVTYVYDATDSGSLGELLEIRLISDPGTGEVDFDDVQLDAIPEPATMGLLGMGALYLIRRKRK